VGESLLHKRRGRGRGTMQSQKAASRRTLHAAGNGGDMPWRGWNNVRNVSHRGTKHGQNLMRGGRVWSALRKKGDALARGAFRQAENVKPVVRFCTDVAKTSGGGHGLGVTEETGGRRSKKGDMY